MDANKNSSEKKTKAEQKDLDKLLMQELDIDKKQFKSLKKKLSKKETL